MSEIGHFIRRNSWAGAILAFILGLIFGPGGLWQCQEVRLKTQSRNDERVGVEKGLYERLQILQDRVLSKIPAYVKMRDAYLDKTESYEQQNERIAFNQDLLSQIGEYNRLEFKLSKMENRQPRWFVVPVPPTAPQRVELIPDGEPVPPAEGPTSEARDDHFLQSIDQDIKAIQNGERH